ncbi:platelet-activating factor acetylhydrolase 2, cytoplasmic isoform X2 [Dendropsophus ebraccatus]|uniref:platelet-activating factor acetylhydrolase 2, cytoplasmic isoform X2 n=1 Tax=Dendropsophus ebraccatus TaxID=150705 RepID=UPI003830FD9B
MGGAVSLRLPRAAGAHPVGSTDILVGAGTEGCFFRLFYPCSPSAAQKTHPPWFPRPQYLSGLLGIRGWEGRAAQYGAALLLGSPQIPVSWNEDFSPGVERRPLIIFSHGLGVFRTVYSSLCMELASNGFLVAALEHRDGSACATPQYSGGDANTSLHEVWVPFRKVQPGMKEFYLRNYQDRIDFSRVAVMGHSFGGAAALLSLAKDNIFRCAVVLDAWMFPLEETCYPNIQKPILLINTETFQTRESIVKIKKLNSDGADLKYMTVKGCVHQSQTDFAFVTGYLVDKIAEAQGTMDPHHCLRIHIASSLDFLQKHLDLDISVPKVEDLREMIQSEVICGFPVINDSKL